MTLLPSSLPLIKYSVLLTPRLKYFFYLQLPLHPHCPHSGFHRFSYKLLQQSSNQFSCLKLQPSLHPAIYSPTPSRMTLLKYRSGHATPLIKNFKLFPEADKIQTTEHNVQSAFQSEPDLSTLPSAMYPEK